MLFLLVAKHITICKKDIYFHLIYQLYYAVMVYTNVRGERKEKCFPTKIPVEGNKTTANIYTHLDL